MTPDRARSAHPSIARLLKLAPRAGGQLSSPSRLRTLVAYAIAVFAPALLTYIVSAQPDTWPKPYSWQYLGITLAAALVGGFGPGVVALAGGTASVLWLRVPTPVHPGVEMFVAVGVALVAILERFRRTQRELRERAAVLQAVIESMPDAVYVGSSDGITLCNTNAVRMLGAQSVDDLRTRIGELGRRLAIRSPETGRPLGEDELQFTRALRGETVVEEVLATSPATGADLYIRSACAPIVDGDTVIGAVAVNSDITDRKRAQQALEAARQAADRARQAAEEASKAKDHFLAVLSHELRTPLSPVLAGLALLKRDPGLSGRASEYVDVMRRNIEVESRLIDDLLDVTRITHGQIELARRPVDLRTILERAIDVCRPDIVARKVHFGVDYRLAGPCFVEADDGRLQQVFWNLLKNAIKFTPRNGCVGIRCTAEDGGVVVEINDSGVGIAPDDLGSIFDAFAQAERTLSRQFGGLGLGLTISRALVEQHGGTISARSDGLGKGATFAVRLPTVPVVPPAPAIDSERHLRRTDRHLRVLLVEDHGDTAEMMRAMLERAGHLVELSADVATALDVSTRTDYDLLVSDLGLPDRSGLDLLRELRGRGHRMPAIAVSGYGHDQDVRQSLAAGFSSHLVKPIDLARLLEAIDAAVTTAPAG